MDWHRTLLLLLSTQWTVAQVEPATTVVLVRTAGAAQSQLLGIDGGGAVAAFGRFPSDALPPLAVEVDPLDRQVLLAVDLGGGWSRLVRLLPGPGRSFAGELPLADLPGRCGQLAVLGDELLAVVEGGSGGIFRLPRRGGASVLAVAQSEASALLTFGQGPVVMLAWSGQSGPPATMPGLVHVDLATGVPVYGSFPFQNLPGRAVTGLIDLPTGLSRQLLACADGTFWLHTGGLGDPTPVPMNPQPPPGGAVAFKQDGYGFAGLGLGGAAYPFVYRADWGGALAVLAGPLPGDPVDLAPPLPADPQVLHYGSGCGAPALTLITGVRGPPQVGNLSFDLRAGSAAPLQLVVFAAGFSDVLGGALPVPLPGGCLLEVAPDTVLLSFANAGGLAVQGIPIPADPTLAGLLLFAQWLQLQGTAFATSPAAAVQIGL